MSQRIQLSQHHDVSCVSLYETLSLEDIDFDAAIGLNVDVPSYVLLDVSQLSAQPVQDIVWAIPQSSLMNKNVAHLAVYANPETMFLVSALSSAFAHDPERLSIHYSHEEAEWALLNVMEGITPLPATISTRELLVS